MDSILCNFVKCSILIKKVSKISNYTIFIEPYDEKIICCQLDGMCVISKNTSFRNAYEILKKCIKKNAEAINLFILSSPKDLPAVHHFAPEDLCHFVTIVCSHNQIDSYSK